MLSSRPVALNPDAQFYGARTPGRALKGRVENAIHPGAVTVNGKGKTAVSRTPFHPATLREYRYTTHCTTMGLRVDQRRAGEAVQGSIDFPATQTHNSHDARGCPASW